MCMWIDMGTHPPCIEALVRGILPPEAIRSKCRERARRCLQGRCRLPSEAQPCEARPCEWRSRDRGAAKRAGSCASQSSHAHSPYT